MLKQKIQQIIQTPKKAAINVALLSIIPFLHLLGLLLMLLVTLRKGARAGLPLAGIVSVCTLILSVLIYHRMPEEIVLQLLNPFLLCGLALVLYQTASWEKVIQLMTCIGIAIVCWIGFFYPHTIAVWSQTWSHEFALNVQQMIKLHPSLDNKFTPQEWQQAIHLMGALAPGFRPLLFAIAGLLSLVLARYMQAALYFPGGFKKELSAWHVGYATGGMITLLLMLAYFEQTPILLSILPILMLPLLCNGLGLAHFMTASYRYQPAILFIFYASIFFLLQPLILFVLLIGYLDCFIHFRKYFTQK